MEKNLLFIGIAQLCILPQIRHNFSVHLPDNKLLAKDRTVYLAIPRSYVEVSMQKVTQTAYIIILVFLCSGFSGKESKHFYIAVKYATNILTYVLLRQVALYNLAIDQTTALYLVQSTNSYIGRVYNTGEVVGQLLICQLLNAKTNLEINLQLLKHIKRTKNTKYANCANKCLFTSGTSCRQSNRQLFTQSMSIAGSNGQYMQ